jgi:hypothetical protein
MLSRWRENFHEPIAISGHVVMPLRILLGVGHKQAATNVLGIERRESSGNSLPSVIVVSVMVDVRSWIKGVTRQIHSLEIRVIHFHAACPKIRHIQESLSIDVDAGCALIYRTICRAIIVIVHRPKCRWATIPSRKSSRLRSQK